MNMRRVHKDMRSYFLVSEGILKVNEKQLYPRLTLFLQTCLSGASLTYGRAGFIVSSFASHKR